jgi:hypothetical protein
VEAGEVVEKAGGGDLVKKAAQETLEKKKAEIAAKLEKRKKEEENTDISPPVADDFGGNTINPTDEEEVSKVRKTKAYEEALYKICVLNKQLY